MKHLDSGISDIKPVFTIVIPVFNSPHRIKDLSEALISNTNPHLLKEIIIGDDASDDVTKEVINQFVSSAPFKVRVIKNLNNQGYLANSNALYRSASTDYVVFLNSDTLVPQGWLERVHQAFLHDEKIVLATPFSNNAKNITLLLNEGQTWRDIDRGLQSFSPRYPAAQTAVGFCLAIKKALWQKEDLFDAVYGVGYWEEVDLHYRVLNEGYRSVIVDDLYVYHANGSSSFSQTHDLKAISDKNEIIFQSRWGDVYTQNETYFKKQKPFAHWQKNNRFTYQEPRQEIDILFVLPAFIKNSGGCNVVFEFIKYLTIHNISVSLLVTNAIDENHVNFLSIVNPWRSMAALKQSVAKIKMIFATYHKTVPVAKALSQHYKAQLSYMVQGPESLFDAGQAYMQTVTDYQTINSIFCISECLKQYLSRYGASNPICLPLGVDQYQYYLRPSSAERNKKAIAVCLRRLDTKGTGEALYALHLAKQAGFEIHFFGGDSNKYLLASDFGKQHGDLNPLQICKLFNEVGFYLDFSYFEGLGLLALEAANCGAIPILHHNGGADSVFTHEENAFFVKSIFVEEDFFENLLLKDSTQFDSIRSSMLNIRHYLSLQNAREMFLSESQKLMASCLSSTNEPLLERKVWRRVSIIYSRTSLYRMAHKLYRYFNYYFGKIVKKCNKDVVDQLEVMQAEIISQRVMLKKLSERLLNENDR